MLETKHNGNEETLSHEMKKKLSNVTNDALTINNKYIKRTITAQRTLFGSTQRVVLVVLHENISGGQLVF